MRFIKYRECNFWCLGNQKLNFRNTKIRLQKNVIKKIILYRDFITFWNKCLKCFFSRNLYFNKIVFYSRNLCRMHRLCKYASAVNEKEIQRDIHFEQSQRRIGEESEDTDANRLYFVVPKKRRRWASARTCRAAPKRGPRSLFTGENIHEYTARNFLFARLSRESTTPRVCACKCDATARRWYFGVRRARGTYGHCISALARAPAH